MQETAIDQNRENLIRMMSVIPHGTSEETMMQVFHLLRQRREVGRSALQMGENAHEAIEYVQQINKQIKELLMLY